MQIASAKSASTREASYQPAFMSNCLAITHPCLSCLPRRLVSSFVLYPFMIGLNGVSVDGFLRKVSMVLVLWEVRAILGNGYGIQGENYVALFLGNYTT